VVRVSAAGEVSISRATRFLWKDTFTHAWEIEELGFIASNILKAGMFVMVVIQPTNGHSAPLPSFVQIELLKPPMPPIAEHFV